MKEFIKLPAGIQITKSDFAESRKSEVERPGVGFAGNNDASAPLHSDESACSDDADVSDEWCVPPWNAVLVTDVRSFLQVRWAGHACVRDSIRVGPYGLFQKLRCNIP